MADLPDSSRRALGAVEPAQASRPPATPRHQQAAQSGQVTAVVRPCAVKTHLPAAPPHRCSDYDEDCLGLDYVRCWLYDTTRGYCPFLRSEE